MPRYTVQHSYKAYRDGRLLGPWEVDTEIEVDEADAEWINRDSPGTLAGLDTEPDPAAEEEGPEAEEEATQEPQPEATPEPKPTPASGRRRGGTKR